MVDPSCASRGGLAAIAYLCKSFSITDRVRFSEVFGQPFRRLIAALAAWFNDTPAVIQALMEAGADREARDRFGRTPWDYAQDRIAFAEAQEDANLARGLRRAFEVN